MRLPAGIAILVALLACGPDRPPTAPASTGEVSTAAAIADLESAVAFFEAVHPAPHRYATRAAIDAEVARARARLSERDRPHELEVAGAIMRVLALAGDSHIEVGGLQVYRDPQIELLPLTVIELDGAHYVDAAGIDVAPGTRVAAINGEPAAGLHRKLAELVTADGADPRARQRALEQDYLRYYHLHARLPGRYTIDLIDGDGSRRVELPPVGRAVAHRFRRIRRSAARWGSPPPESGPAWPELRHLDGQTALLRVHSFGIADQAEFARRIDRAMAGLSAERLIIDLRGNEGGLRTNAIALLNHLLPTRYQQWTAMRIRAVDIPARFEPRVVYPMGNDPRWLKATFGDSRERTGDPLADRMVPNADRFGGQVIVLVDALTNSAANSFVLALVRYRPETVLVGEPLGGACDRHVGELPVVYTTPNYGVAVLMSLIEIDHIEVAGCQPGRGLSPTISVDYTAADLAAGRDPWLETARALR